MANFRGNTALFLIGMLLLAQIGVAQHFASECMTHAYDDHDHHHHHGHSHNDQQHNEKNKTGDNCQICFIAKSIAYGFAGDEDRLILAVHLTQAFWTQKDQVAGDYQSIIYRPRAPPTFLI